MSIQDKDEDDANNSDSLLWRSGLLLRSKALTGTLLNTVRACNILSSQCLPSLPQTWVHMHPHSQLHTRTREGRRAFGRVLNCVVLSDARLPPLPLSRSLSERARSSAPISARDRGLGTIFAEQERDDYSSFPSIGKEGDEL